MSKNFYKLFLIILVFCTGILGFFYFSNSEKLISVENVSVDDKIEQIAQGVENVSVDDKIEQIAQGVENIRNIKVNKKNENDKSKETNQEIIVNADNGLKIKDKLVDWGFTKTNGRKIDTIILHSSYDAIGDKPYDLGGLIAEYKQYGVAPHYLIDRKGKIYRLVKDKNIAWHAGVSEIPDGRKNVNSFSIGVEIMNTKTDGYTKKQYQATQKLIDYLKKEYKIKYILGHDDIAPERKTDPWNFEWKKIER